MSSPTTADRGRAVRVRLHRAAVELIVERGWSAVSTRLLAERADVAPGVVHYHFASLRELLAEAALAATREVIGQLWPALDSARTPDDLVDVLFGSLDGYTGEDPTSLLVTETALAATRDEQLREAMGQLITDFRTRLAELLRAHRLDSPEQTAAVLAAAIDGVLLHRALSSGLPASAVAPILRKTLTPTPDATNRKGGKKR